MNISESAALFKCLGDKTRLEIISMLRKSDSYVEYIASALSLTPATVCFHLKKLEAAGIVRSSRTQFYIIYSLCDEIFEKKLSDIAFFEQSDAPGEEKYEKAVIDAFIRDGKLVSIPVQRKKREIILKYLLELFEYGRDYTEREVSEKLGEYNEDFCTLRRELIACGYMKRDHDIYRRVENH